MGLEMMTKSSLSGQVDNRRTRERQRQFQILGAVALKLRAPNKVRTNGTESGLVYDNLIERV